jgi:hypothetical protein
VISKFVSTDWQFHTTGICCNGNSWCLCMIRNRIDYWAKVHSLFWPACDFFSFFSRFSNFWNYALKNMMELLTMHQNMICGRWIWITISIICSAIEKNIAGGHCVASGSAAVKLVRWGSERRLGLGQWHISSALQLTGTKTPSIRQLHFILFGCHSLSLFGCTFFLVFLIYHFKPVFLVQSVSSQSA